MDPVDAGVGIPKAATRLHTAPGGAKARAAVVAPVDDDLGTLLDTALSKLSARMEATLNSAYDGDACAKGLEIKKLMTLIENGLNTLEVCTSAQTIEENIYRSRYIFINTAREIP